MNQIIISIQLAILTSIMFLPAGCGGNAPGLPTVGSLVVPTISPAATQTHAPITTETPKPTLAQVRPTPTERMTKERVTFKSGDLTLVGYIYKPGGAGPFPSLISNHGSDKDPYAGNVLDVTAMRFVEAGYVLFVPLRRGHGESPGPYIKDQLQQERKAKGDAAADQLQVQILEGPELDDQLAGLAYLKSLSYVDKNRLGVIGCSAGGTQTLLAAERNPGYKAAVAMSPGAEDWGANPAFQQRLIKAVSGINIPVFLIHPAKDVSLLPGQTLAKEFERLGKPYELKIYPDTVGTAQQQEHCFGGAVGIPIYMPDVMAFFSKYIK
jgi:dienelactone hydrolase